MEKGVQKFRIMKKLKQGYVNRFNVYAFDVETEQDIVDFSLTTQKFRMGSIVGLNYKRVFWNQFDWFVKKI